MSMFLNWIPWYFNDSSKEIEELEVALSQATTYQSWKKIALKLDALKGNEEWKATPSGALYDHQLISDRLKSLKASIETKEHATLLKTLRSGLLRNLGGLANASLYTRVHHGTKHLIEEYVKTVLEGLQIIIAEYDAPLKDKFDFFWETRQAFGRSALLLSGGASLGLYHIGVIKALFEHNLLPRVISGSSVGSIIAAIIATRLDDELPAVFRMDGVTLNAFEPNGSFQRKLTRLLTKGVIMDITKLQTLIRDNIGDLTFKEAFNRTHRILNITVASTAEYEVPRLLNYLTSPDVLIWSAASASCALTGLYEPVELMAKGVDGNLCAYHPSSLKWSDGSVQYDLPMTRLSELFNVNHFIVSQVNPHVVPFVTSTRGASNAPTFFQRIKYLTVSEINHRIFQIASLGMLPKSLTFLLNIVIQSYSGDINIVPHLTLCDYLNLLSNPTVEFVKHCTLNSERNTWELMSMIKGHCAISKALEDCVQKLRIELYEDHESALAIFNDKLTHHM